MFNHSRSLLVDIPFSFHIHVCFVWLLLFFDSTSVLATCSMLSNRYVYIIHTSFAYRFVCHTHKHTTLSLSLLYYRYITRIYIYIYICIYTYIHIYIYIHTHIYIIYRCIFTPISINNTYLRRRSERHALEYRLDRTWPRLSQFLLGAPRELPGHPRFREGYGGQGESYGTKPGISQVPSGYVKIAIENGHL